jgi:hypothetical protein
MCDPNVVVVRLLNNDAAVIAIVDGQIWSPSLPSPESYRPDVNGAGISLHVRGGKNGLYDPIVEPSFQVTTWDVSSKKARATMSAVTAVLHDLVDQTVTTVDGVARVATGIQEVYPQDVTDSDTGWFTCVSFFRLKMVL